MERLNKPLYQTLNYDWHTKILNNPTPAVSEPILKKWKETKEEYGTDGWIDLADEIGVEIPISLL